jgi:hypothetical protein
MFLAVMVSSTATNVLAQDVRSDRSSIGVIMVSGNDRAFGGNENFSYLKRVLGGTTPENSLGFNLTVKSSLVSEGELSSARLLIISLPDASSIPNSTIIKRFLDNGGSIFLLSNYYGGAARNSSFILNSIINESKIGNVRFDNGAVSITNVTPDWQTKVYGNNSFAVRVNSSMLQFASTLQPMVRELTEIVILSCGLNITYRNDPLFLGLASAQSDTGTLDWLVLINGTHRSVLCGSASMFNNTYINFGSNLGLLRNLVLWLVQNFETSPPDVFFYTTLASSAIIVFGVAIYVLYGKRRTLL